MNISENIQWITPQISGNFTPIDHIKQRYRLLIRSKYTMLLISRGGVYNCLEDAYEKGSETGYVVTGIVVEMWLIGEKAVQKYNVDPYDITTEPMEVDTVELDTVYAAIMISNDTQFTLEVDYGEKAVLRGNCSEIEYGGGDYVLVMTKFINGEYHPNFNDSDQIVNGAIFDKLYKPFVN